MSMGYPVTQFGLIWDQIGPRGPSPRPGCSPSQWTETVLPWTNLNMYQSPQACKLGTADFDMTSPCILI